MNMLTYTMLTHDCKYSSPLTIETCRGALFNQCTSILSCALMALLYIHNIITWIQMWTVCGVLTAVTPKSPPPNHAHTQKSLQHNFTIQQHIHFPSVRGTHFCLHYCGVLLAIKSSHSPVCQYHSTVYTKWEKCNHSFVSVTVSTIKQWLAGS